MANLFPNRTAITTNTANLVSSNRVLLGNLCLASKDDVAAPNSAVMLINLFTFRRMILSPEQFELLCSCQHKQHSATALSSPEQELLQLLRVKKQILDEAEIADLDEYRRVEYNQSLDETLPKEAIASVLTILPSFACNFACTYCYQASFANKNLVLDTAMLEQIFAFVRQLNGTSHFLDGVKGLVISGGEVLLERTVPLLNYILAQIPRDSSCQLKLLTNGSNIMRYKNEVDFARFHDIQVSLDGIDAVFANVNRTTTSRMADVLAGIEYLLGLGVHLDLICMLTPETVQLAEDLLQELALRFPHNKELSLLFTPVSNFAQGETIDQSFLSFEAYLAAKKRLASLEIDFPYSVNPCYEVRYINQAIRRTRNERQVACVNSCNITSGRNFVFAPDGKVYWCSCAVPNNGVVGTFAPTISIAETAVQKILYRSTLNIPKCQKCDFRYLCGGGCTQYSLARNDDAETASCALFAHDFFLRNLEQFL